MCVHIQSQIKPLSKERNMFHSGDDIGAIVADIGSQNARVGFAGEDYPKSFIPTVRGVCLVTE
jgi:hypothetical protein